jgi:hypothetical protein
MESSTDRLPVQRKAGRGCTVVPAAHVELRPCPRAILRGATSTILPRMAPVGADLAATCVASEMPLPRYPGTSGPRDAAAILSMQAISGGGDPATTYMYPAGPPRLVMRASFFSWLVALIDGA